MNDQQSNSTQLVLTIGATGQLGPRPVCGLPRRRAMLRPPIKGRGARRLRGNLAAVAELVLHLDSDVTDAVMTPVEQFAREHKDAFGRPVSVT
jgi:hypothetical protein